MLIYVVWLDDNSCPNHQAARLNPPKSWTQTCVWGSQEATVKRPDAGECVFILKPVKTLFFSHLEMSVFLHYFWHQYKLIYFYLFSFTTKGAQHAESFSCTRLRPEFQTLDIAVFAVWRPTQEVEFIHMETKVLWVPEGTGCDWGHGYGASSRQPAIVVPGFQTPSPFQYETLTRVDLPWHMETEEKLFWWLLLYRDSCYQ